MIPAAFDYVAPKSLQEASRLLREHGEKAKLLAGGHSLIPLLKLRLAQPSLLIDLRHLEDLRKLEKEGRQLRIGALCTHYELETSPLLARHCPLLQQSAASIGDVQVRNWGTIGGSLAHADPAADYPAALLALEASVELYSAGQKRELAVSEFLAEAFFTALRPGELITAIRVPIPGPSGCAYLKVPQKASGFALVGAAALVQLKGDRFQRVRLGFTGVSSRPYRAVAVEEALQGERANRRSVETACAAAAQGVEPLSDLHASAEYRAHLARVYGRRAILAALASLRS